jgi:hypothetical protein
VFICLLLLQLEAVLLLTAKPKNFPSAIQKQQTCCHISLHFLFQNLLGILILVRIFKDGLKISKNFLLLKQMLFSRSDAYDRRVKIQQTHFAGADIRVLLIH